MVSYGYRGKKPATSEIAFRYWLIADVRMVQCFFFFNRGIPAGIIFVILNIITVTLIQSLGWNHSWKHCQPYMFDGFK